MTPHNNKLASQMLDQYLRGELDASHPGVPADEAELAEQIRAAAARLNPDPQFAAALERKLRQPRTDSPLWGQRFLRVWPSLAGAAALVILGFALHWIVQSIAPRPAIPAVSSTGTPIYVVEAGTPEPRETPSGPLFTSPYTGGQYQLQADFPPAPAQATLYRQVPSLAGISLEFARQTAARIGLEVPAYTAPGLMPGQQAFLFTDGKARLFVYGPDHFLYYAESSAQRLAETISEENMVQAEAFLAPLGLLDFPYITKTSIEQPGVLSFVPTLDGIPVSYGANFNPTVDVLFNKEGQVNQIFYDNLPFFEALDAYPIISAEQAWEKFTSGTNPLGVQVSGYGFTPSTFKDWYHSHPLDQPVTFYGSLDTYPSAEGGEPLLLVENVPLSGNWQGLETLDIGQYVRLEGQFYLENDVRKFQVETWEKSESNYFQGTLTQADGEVWLSTPDGLRLKIMDAPQDLPLGEEVGAFGVVNGDELNWTGITQGQGGGGGGGGGGPSLAKLNLSGIPMPTATPPAYLAPIDNQSLVGQKVDGLRASVNFHYLEDEDGSIRVERFFANFDTEAPMPAAVLEGPAAAKLEEYFLLPMNIWGSITNVDPVYDLPVITVERVEPVYPGLKMQAWLGTQESRVVEGTEVLLYTTQDGMSYVLSSSIDYGPEANRVGEPGDLVLIEGLVYPDETFGGLPVLHEFSTGTEAEDIDLNEYSLQSVPDVVPDSVAALVIDPASSIAVIDKIELAYYTIDLRYRTEIEPGWIPYAQPVWHFSGRYNDFSFFDILIQALPDEYLSPEPDEECIRCG
jgi:hypothetical protein